MKMQKVIMGWSNGIELVGGNVDVYRTEILRSIEFVCNIENIEYKEDVFNKMLDSFRRSSEYFPEIFKDLIYNYRSRYMDTYTINFNLVLYIIKLYKLLGEVENPQSKLNEAMIENGFVQFLKICTEIQVAHTYDLYNAAYLEAKGTIEKFFNSDSEARDLYDAEKYFKAFIKLKEETRSAIMSHVLKHDKDDMIGSPSSLKHFTIMTAVISEILSLSVLINDKTSISYKTSEFYFKDITNEFNYEIIKTK